MLDGSFFTFSRKQKRAIERKLGKDALNMLGGGGGLTESVQSKETDEFNKRALNLYITVLKSTRVLDEESQTMKSSDPALLQSLARFRKEIETNPNGPISTFGTRQANRLGILLTRKEEEILKMEDDNLLEAEFGLKRNWHRLGERKEDVWTNLDYMCKHAILYSFDVIMPLLNYLPKDIKKMLETVINLVKEKFFSMGTVRESFDLSNVSEEDKAKFQSTFESQINLVENFRDSIKSCKDPKRMKQVISSQIHLLQKNINFLSPFCKKKPNSDASTTTSNISSSTDTTNVDAETGTGIPNSAAHSNVQEEGNSNGSSNEDEVISCLEELISFVNVMPGDMSENVSETPNDATVDTAPEAEADEDEYDDDDDDDSTDDDESTDDESDTESANNIAESENVINTFRSMIDQLSQNVISHVETNTKQPVLEQPVLEQPVLDQPVLDQPVVGEFVKPLVVEKVTVFPETEILEYE